MRNAQTAPSALTRRDMLLASTTASLAAASLAASAAVAQPTSPWLTAHPQLALKLMIIGRRRPGTTLAEHRHHIRQVHGQLVLQNIAVDPDNAPRRYVQNPAFDGSFRAGKPGTDPFALNCDFVTQIWMPDFPSLGRARQSAFYLEKVQHDEDNFVDQATVVFMSVHERVRAEPGPPTPGLVKLFGMLQRAPGVAPEDFRRAWMSAAWPAADQAGLLRHVQNDTLPTPAGPPALDGIDEFWCADEASARRLLQQWQGWVASSLVRPGMVAEGSSFALLAHEDVLHAGPR